METKRKKPQKFMSRIWVKEVDKDRYLEDQEGHKHFNFTQWRESTDDVNLGSISKPNPDILEIKMVCIEITEKDDEEYFKNAKGFFGRFF